VAVRLAAGAKAERFTGTSADHSHGDDSSEDVLRNLRDGGRGDAAALGVTAEGELLAGTGLGLLLKAGEHVLHAIANRVLLGVGLTQSVSLF
jgi:hypothetical protein